MCKCANVVEHSKRSRYVEPSVGDDVIRYGDDSGLVGLLYHLDA